jgi:hypothetical protein
MNKRTTSLLVLVVIGSLFSFGSDSQRNSAASQRSVRSAVRKIAQPPVAPPTNIGFLSPPRSMAEGAIFGIFPAVMGDFKGDGNQDAATLVNTSPGKHLYQISAAMNDGAGNFTTVLTPTVADNQQDPLFVAHLKGAGEATDDILLVHPATSGGVTYVQAWLSNGDGTFAAVGTGTRVTTNSFAWATVVVPPTGCPYVVLADAATPNGNIWTVQSDCNGNFTTPTSSVPITGALSAGSPSQGVPGNPMVFADLNGDGSLDFAAPAAANNQIVVYLCATGTSPCPSYAAPVPLATPDNTYGSCFLGGGDLNGDGRDELVSANCLNRSVTAYVNNGGGGFATGVYYPKAGANSTTGFANPAAISIADVDGNGHNDIVVTDLNTADIKVLLGNGDGTVNLPSAGYVTGGAPLMPALIAHFNGASNPVGVLLPDNQANFVYLQGYGDGTFRSGINYYAQTSGGGFEPEGVGLASGDFNGDGIPDFVIGNSDCTPKCNHAPITVFLSNADGSLNPGMNYSPNGSYILQFVAVADFNGDGKLDIAASDTLNGRIQIFLGDGKGGFSVGLTYPTDTAPNAHPVGIVAADFNGDGKPDLAIVNNFGPINSPTSADVGVLINDGKGAFNTLVNSPALTNVATELTAADVNGDGILDLVAPLYGQCALGTCNSPGNAVAILLRNGDGSFQAESDFKLVDNNGTTYNNPYHAAMADLNGDGKADLVVTIQDQVHTVNQGIAVALGNGSATFFGTPTVLQSTPQNQLFASPPLPAYVKIVDLNRDGYPDLVFTNALEGGVGVLYGLGDGTFPYDALEFAANRWAWDFALVDINGDGVPDVVASGFQQSFSGVGVLLNTSGSSIALTSSALKPTTGQSVTFTATITGSKVRGVTAAPTGSVTFFDGTTALGAGAPIKSGAATTSAIFATAGPHNITAQYSGDTSYVRTTSTAVQENVVQGGSPDYTLTPDATSKTVNAGSPASFTITLAPLNGYNGTVTLACPATLPTGVSCTLPSPMAPPSYPAATLTINTAARKAAVLRAPDVNPHHGEPNLWASLSGLGMIGMILAGDWKRRNRRGLAIVLLIVALAMILALVGCGGSSTSGGGGGGGGGGTPAGSYPITVTATGTAGNNGGNTTPHPVSVTLIVN